MLGRHTYARWYDQRPSGHARCRCSAAATRVELRWWAPARALVASAGASLGRQGVAQWQEDCAIVSFLSIIIVFCLDFATNMHARYVAHPKFNIEVTINKFSLAFFCHL